MKAAEYLDAAKQRLCLSSDYKLSKILEVTPGHIAEYRSEKRGIPLDQAFRLAITLEIDPALVVADLEAQRAKNPARAAFWRSFLLRARVLAVLLCTLASISFGGAGSDPGRLGGAVRRRLNVA